MNETIWFYLFKRQVGYNRIIRCNRKFMFCKDRRLWYRFQCLFVQGYGNSLCAHHFWGFPPYLPALFGIPTLPPAGRKKVAFQRFNPIENQTFGAGVSKKYFPFYLLFENTIYIYTKIYLYTFKCIILSCKCKYNRFTMLMYLLRYARYSTEIKLQSPKCD